MLPLIGPKSLNSRVAFREELACSVILKCHQGSLPPPMTNSCMTGEMSPQEIMVANTDQKHLLVLYAFPVKEAFVGLIPADECHAATPDFLGLWGFELTSQAFVPSTSLTLPSPYPQHLRIL